MAIGPRTCGGLLQLAWLLAVLQLGCSAAAACAASREGCRGTEEEGSALLQTVRPAQGGLQAGSHNGTKGTSSGPLHSAEKDPCNGGNDDQCDGTMVCGRYCSTINYYQCCPAEWSEQHSGVTWCANQEGGECSDGLDDNCKNPLRCKSDSTSRSGYTCQAPPTPASTPAPTPEPTSNPYPHPLCVDGARDYECFSATGFCQRICDGPPPCHWAMQPCPLGTMCITQPEGAEGSPCMQDED